MKKIFVLFFLMSGIVASVAQINTDRVIAIGRNALYFEDYILSIQYFNQVIRAKPWLAHPYFYRAYAKLNLDDFSGAEEDCNLALQQNPFLINAYLARGIARHSQGKYDLAIEDYSKGLSFRPKDRPMMKNTAIAYIQKKDYEKAMACFDELIEMYPKDANNYLARGSIHIEKEDTAAALADYNKAIEIDPYYAYSYGNRAIIHYQQDDLPAALSDLNEAIRLSPREEGFYINRGLVRYNTNDLRGAMSDYDIVIALNSNNLIARYNRGLLRFEVGDYNRAIEDFNVVIDLEPDNYMAYYNRALLHSSVGAYRDAITDYDVILEQYPNFLPAYYNRSDAKRNINDIAGADKDYWYAMELDRTKGNLPAFATPNKPAQTTAASDETEDEEKKATREASDRNINKFNSLVVYNKEDEQKSKYQSEIRGRVQDKNITIKLESQFVLTYYEKTGKVNDQGYFNNSIATLNDRAALGWNLLITNKEASLNEFQIEAHFTSIDNISAKIDQNNKNADYYFGLGIDYMLIQDFTEAILNFDKAIEINPSYTLAYFNRAVVRYKQYEYENSNVFQDEFSETINLSVGVNRSGGLTTAPVTTPLENRNYLFDMVIRDYSMVIQKDPSFTFAYFNRANLRFKQQDFKTAIQDYNEAIRRNPDFAEAYYNRGLSYFSQGNARQGVSDLSKAGELGIIEAYSIIKRMTAN